MDFRRQSTFLSILGLLATTTLVTSTTTSSTSLGPVTDLPIVNAVVSPDGYPRSAVLAGGLLPGPVITGNKGDHFKINVIDGLSDDTMARATSVHWHGLFQKGTPWADGPSFVTQCPIIPDNSFLYEFDVPDQAGTFWYHSHFSTQYCDGLRGAFIVYDRENDPYKDMYDVDDESTIITLADWYHLPASVLASLPPPPQWNSTLINGIGRVKGGPAVPLAVVNVEYGKKYRLRVIEMACQPAYNFSIDSHELTIIEADGEYTQPLTVSSVPIFVGQRYSLILDASQPVGNYPIRANPSTGNGGFEGGVNMAILRYVGAPIEEPDWHVQEDNDPSSLHEEDLHALIDPAAPGEPDIDGADVNINMVFSIDFTTGNFAINNATWIPPTVPVLLQILSGAQSAADLLPSGSLYSLPLNQTIQITLTPDATATLAGAPHPFHLHGHSFSVVRSAGSSVYNWDNPVRRDVVSTGVTGDNVTIRFRTDNGGPWFLHCHIDWHLDEGLAVVLAEDIPEIKTEAVPTDWKNLCPTYGNFTS